jgi:F-type H+-transporting ATPase subunit epsilon
LQVKLVMPEGEIWAGQADRVIAKTLDGDIGILTGHSPVLGILAPGSVVRILTLDGTAAEQTGPWVDAAVGGGFLSVADNRVSILARQAILGADVDRAAARAELTAATADGAAGSVDGDAAAVEYLRAQLRAAGDDA